MTHTSSRRWAAAIVAAMLALHGCAVAPEDDAGEELATRSSELADGARRDRILETGEKYLETPYEFGAKYGQTDTFDCSSFVKTVFAENGVTLPRTSKQQATRGKAVTRRNLKKGDLVFFKRDRRPETPRTVTHVAIYAGDGLILHTYGEGGVRYTDLDGYWADRAVGYRDVLR